MKKNKPKQKKDNKRLFDIFIIAVSAVVLIFLVLTVVKINSGVAQTIESPKQLVLLQLINSSGDRDAAQLVKDAIAQLSLENLEIKIVEESSFKLQEVKESYLINRIGDEDKLVEQFAALFKFDKNLILKRSLEFNKNHVNISLVLGQDYSEKVLNNLLNRSENNQS